MKKFTLAVIIIGSFILFSLLSTQSNTLALPPKSTTDPGASALPSATSSVPAASGTADPPNATNTPGALYKDGTYTGSVADAQWGNIQVQVVILQGKMTKITFLQYPNERDRSVMINDYADPQLTTEAIQAQSATVDIVTGATDSSEAFMQSLSDALTQAHT